MITLKKPFTINATFFIPSNPEVEYRGILINSPERGIFLELYDLSLGQGPNFHVPLLCGRFGSDPYTFTLIEVRGFSNVFSGNPTAITSTTKCNVARCLLGPHYSDPNELVFNEIQFSYSNFREWINEPSIFTEFGENTSTTKFVELPDINGSLDNTFDYSIKRTNTGSYPEKSFDISISQAVTFSIISKDNKLLPLNDFLKLNMIIKTFFMFMQRTYVNEESIFCINELKNTKAELIQFFPQYSTPKKLKNREFHIAYSRISMKFEGLLQKWIEKYKEMPEFFNSFFENKINDHLEVTDKFENLIQSLLYYHRYKFKEEIMPSEEYKEFIKNMKNKLDTENEKQFIERFRNIGNYYSIGKQLDQILEQLEYLKDKKTRGNYIREIVKIRNSLSHSKIESKQELLQKTFNMTFNLDSTIQSLIRLEIEFDSIKYDNRTE